MERAWSGDGCSTIEHRSSSWALRKHREAAGITQVSQIRSTTCGQDPISGLPATHLLRAAQPTPLYTLHVCNYLRNAAPAGGCAFAFPIAQRPRAVHSSTHYRFIHYHHHARPGQSCSVMPSFHYTHPPAHPSFPVLTPPMLTLTPPP